MFTILSLACLLLTQPGQAEATAQLPWFADAEIAGAIRLEAPADAPSAVPGTNGEGVRVSGPVALEGFSLHQDAGMISLWVRPNWSGADGERHTILRIGDPSKNGLLLEKSSRGMLRFVMASPQAVTASRADVSGWRPGEWHHVAIAWFSRDGRPIGLPLWIDRKAVAGPMACANRFLDPAALDDATIWLGDETTDADVDELIVRHDLNAEGNGQLGVVWRDYFRTAPFGAIAIEPDSSYVPSDKRVLLGHTKQFGLLAGAHEGMEPVTDFTVRYGCWSEFDAKPFIRWSSSDPAIATVDEKGLVTGVAEGACEVTAEFRGMTGAYPVEVISPDLPDLDLAYVSLLPRYSADRAKDRPAPGDRVTSVAHIVNMGYAEAPAGTVVRFRLHDAGAGPTGPNMRITSRFGGPEPRAEDVLSLSDPIPPRGEVDVEFEWEFPAEPVTMQVTVDPDNVVKELCEANNEVEELSTARPLWFSYEQSHFDAIYEQRRENLVGSFSYYDYIRANKLQLDRMLKEAALPETTPEGVQDAYRIDVMGPAQKENEERPFGLTQDLFDGGFPCGTHDNLMALDSGLIHEFGHCCLSLPDLYGYGVKASNVFLRDENGEFYAGTDTLPILRGEDMALSSANNVPCSVGYTPLMDYCHLWLHPANAGQIQYFIGYRGPRFWGTQGWLIPHWQNALYITDVNDAPLAGAAVYVYHVSQVGDVQDSGEKYLADRPKFCGNTDEDGRFLFPEVSDVAWDDPDTDEVEGEHPMWNPFHRVETEVAFTPNVWTVEGLLLVKVVSGDQTEFYWLPLTEFNQAFFRGEIQGKLPIRTSLAPSEGQTEIVRPTIPPEIATTNLRPVAVCEPEITVKCGEEYTVDGSKSYDPEGQPLAYRWMRRTWGVDGPPRGTERTFAVKAPSEPTDVELCFYVIDGVRLSVPVNVTVHVIE